MHLLTLARFERALSKLGLSIRPIFLTVLSLIKITSYHDVMRPLTFITLS